MTYIDCFLTPVPRANKTHYEKLAQISSGVVREYGALRVVECWLDETGTDTSTYHADNARQTSDSYATMTAAASAKNDETVVMSWIEWADKRSRDEGMKKVMADSRMQFDDMEPVFDGSSLIAGGFRPMLDHSRILM